MADTNTNQHIIIFIKVDLVLNAKNGLRRVIFGLEKDTQGDVIEWKINFQLFERASTAVDYGDALVSLDVDVKSEFQDKAEIAAKKGLTAKQIAHAVGPAADDAKDTLNGAVDPADAADTVQATLK